MPVADLSHVTESLRTLLGLNVRRLLGGAPPTALNVTALPPERVGNAPNTLNLHLYHVAEDAYYKNAPGPGRGVPNVARAPMALSLYYILTAHHEQNTDFDALTQQRLMGFALKTLHDVPVVTDETAVAVSATDPPEPVLHPQLRGGDNALEIILRPVTPEESIAFWSAEDQQTARLSAYYEVRVVMLEPEVPQRFPGIVLSVGQFVLQLGAPSLDGSRSVVRFNPPAETGLGVQEITVAPARAALDPGSDPPNNALTLSGANLTGGVGRRLVLRSAQWRALTPPVEAVEVDPDLNAPDWGIAFRPERIEVLLGGSVTFEDETGAPRTIAVFPGIYAASVRTVLADRIVGTRRRQVAAESNQVAFAITPRIAAHSAPDPATGRITVDVVNAFDLSDASLDVQVVVDGESYTRAAAFAPSPDPTVNDGLFVVAAAGVTFQPLFDASVPEVHPFRLTVNGAESQPFWIESGP